MPKGPGEIEYRSPEGETFYGPPGVALAEGWTAVADYQGKPDLPLEEPGLTDPIDLGVNLLTGGLGGAAIGGLAGKVAERGLAPGVAFLRALLGKSGQSIERGVREGGEVALPALGRAVAETSHNLSRKSPVPDTRRLRGLLENLKPEVGPRVGAEGVTAATVPAGRADMIRRELGDAIGTNVPESKNLYGRLMDDLRAAAKTDENIAQLVQGIDETSIKHAVNPIAILMGMMRRSGLPFIPRGVGSLKPSALTRAPKYPWLEGPLVGGGAAAGAGIGLSGGLDE